MKMHDKAVVTVKIHSKLHKQCGPAYCEQLEIYLR